MDPDTPQAADSIIGADRDMRFELGSPEWEQDFMRRMDARRDRHAEILVEVLAERQANEISSSHPD